MSEPTPSAAEHVSAGGAASRRGPIQRLVEASVGQPLIIALITLGIIGVGIFSLKRLPVDAYPDVSPTSVAVTSEWPGHAAEEVERLVSVPIETALNGLPNLVVMRSVSLYGLSSIRVTFAEGTDVYFARQQVFERLGDASVPDGVSPGIEAPFSPSGLVYRYVIKSSDRSAMDLHVLQDWVLDKAYRAVPGVADVASLGGETMQYQVLVDPTKLAGAGLAVSDVATALGANNSNAGGGFYSEGGQFFYVRGLGRVVTLEDIGNIVLAVKNSVPILVKDVAKVEIGHAPRLGQFGFNQTDDAVEGIILMRRGEQAQVVLKRVEAKTRELNDQVLPKDVKVVPYYDRSDLVALTTRTVADNLIRGILLVVVVLIFFLYDIRSGLIVAVTVPLALLIAFMCLDLRDIPANLLSIGAIDFGILVDGAVVMVENIYRQLAERHGTEYRLKDVLFDAASEVNRPIVYAIAVIVAGFLPIYALTGPSGKLFRPMADTTIYALLGSLFLTLTLIPVLCAIVLRRGVRERRNHAFEWIRRQYARGLDWCLAHRSATVVASIALFAVSVGIAWTRGGEFMPKLDEGALWVRATMPYTISFEESSAIVPQVRQILKSFPEVTDVASEHGRDDAGTDPTGFFNAEFYVGLKPYREWNGPYHSKDELIAAIHKKLVVFPGITFNYTQPAEDAVDEALTGLKAVTRRESVRHRPQRSRGKGPGDQGGDPEDSGHRARDPGAGVGAAESHDHGRPREDGALWTERRRVERLDRSGGRRRVGDTGRTRGADVRPRRAAAGAISRHAGPNREHPPRDPRWKSSAAARGGRRADREWRRVHLPPGQLALHRRAVLRRGARPGERCRRGASRGRQAGEAAERLHGAVGRRVRGIHGVARADERRAPRDHHPDLCDSVLSI